MGMGMAEGEWAAKRGLPAPKLAGEQASSLGGRQAASRRLVEAVSIPLSHLRPFPVEILPPSPLLDVFKHLVLVFSFGLWRRRRPRS